MTIEKQVKTKLYSTKVVKTLKAEQLSKHVIAYDVFSAICGTIGITLGTLSILALQPFWDSDQQSFILTIFTAIFDSSSTIFAILAFAFGTKVSNLKKQFKLVVSNYEYHANKCDLYSFITGTFGFLLGLLSLLALLSFWNDAYASYIITIFSVSLDVLSLILVLIALVYNLRAIKLEHAKLEKKLKRIKK